MKQRLFLVYDRNGFKSARLLKPHLNIKNIYITLDVEIPNKLFAGPEIKAKITANTETLINTEELNSLNSEIKVESEISNKGAEDEEED